MNDTVLQVQGLRKNYPAFTLSEVSFSLEAGRIMGFIGRNGAGKTTTLKSILGLVHPDAGEIRYFGLPFAQNEQRIKEQIGYAAGGTSYYQRRLVGEIARMTASFYPGWDDAAYRNYLRRFSLDESKCLRELSEGMKVKFLLTLALSHHAKLLLLDEPFSALDYQTRLMVSADICRLIRQAGKTMIIVTHDLSEAISLADKVYVLSARPATIKAVLPIRLTLPDASPLAARNAPEFPYYFKQLWEELTDETTN